jgi:hypothetical protein
VKQARVEENFRALSALLQVRNISTRPVQQALFYGEFYDRRGRLCFTALFDLYKNVQRRSGAVSPGSERTLLSTSNEMAMASRPRLLRLYLLRQFPEAGVANRPVSKPGVYKPPVLRWSSSEHSWQTLCLGPAYSHPALPVEDVALMMVHVDARGRVSGSKVLDAVMTVPFVSWAEGFARHVRFSPARKDGVPMDGKTLILFRALLREWSPKDPAEVARSNPWVVNYVQSGATQQIPAITIVWLFLR